MAATCFMCWKVAPGFLLGTLFGDFGSGDFAQFFFDCDRSFHLHLCASIQLIHNKILLRYNYHLYIYVMYIYIFIYIYISIIHMIDNTYTIYTYIQDIYICIYIYHVLLNTYYLLVISLRPWSTHLVFSRPGHVEHHEELRGGPRSVPGVCQGRLRPCFWLGTDGKTIGKP